jgi:hypothetical protein
MAVGRTRKEDKVRKKKSNVIGETATTGSLWGCGREEREGKKKGYRWQMWLS